MFACNFKPYICNFLRLSSVNTHWPLQYLHNCMALEQFRFIGNREIDFLAEDIEIVCYQAFHNSTEQSSYKLGQNPNIDFVIKI